MRSLQGKFKACSHRTVHYKVPAHCTGTLWPTLYGVDTCLRIKSLWRVEEVKQQEVQEEEQEEELEEQEEQEEQEDGEVQPCP